MRPARQQPQHPTGIIDVHRFTQNVAIDDDGRVCGKYTLAWGSRGNGGRLFTGQPEDVRIRLLSRQDPLVNVGDAHFEWDTGGAKQVGAAWRRRSKDHEPDDNRGVVPVRHFVPEALAALIRKAPTTPDKIAFAWRHSVGPAVAKATTVELVGTTLRVQVQTRQWQRELQRSAAIVRTRLAALLGDDVVRRIEVLEPEQPASRIESARRHK